MAISFDGSETFEVVAGRVRCVFTHPSALEMIRMEPALRRLRGQVGEAVPVGETAQAGVGSEAELAAALEEQRRRAVALGEVLRLAGPRLSVDGTAMVLPGPAEEHLSLPLLSRLVGGYLDRVMITEADLGESPSRRSSAPGTSARSAATPPPSRGGDEQVAEIQITPDMALKSLQVSAVTTDVDGVGPVAAKVTGSSST